MYRACSKGEAQFFVIIFLILNQIQDEDTLSTYKIQSGHTVHLVKGAARAGGSSGSTSGSAPQQLPSMQAGQNPSDPLTILNGPMGHGMAGFNPFESMGLNTNDPNMVNQNFSLFVFYE